MSDGTWQTRGEGLIVLTTHAASRIRTTTSFRAEGLRGGARQVQFGTKLTF